MTEPVAIDNLMLVRLREDLLTLAPVTALTGQRIYAGVSDPPGDWTPEQGAALCAFSRSIGMDHSRHLWRASIQFTCWAASEAEAAQLAETLTAALDTETVRWIRGAVLEMQGPPLRDPDTDWPYIMTAFGMDITRTEE